MVNFWFQGWTGLLRVLAVGPAAYVSLLVVLRISGKRTLSKLNAFDLVVTVALGSTLATIILSKDVALAEGALAFAVLAGLQFAVTWTSIRWGWVRNSVKSEPTLLLYAGEPLAEALRRQRITRDELEAAVRAQNLSQISEAAAVVLETDRSLSVIHRSNGAAGSSGFGAVDK